MRGWTGMVMLALAAAACQRAPEGRVVDGPLTFAGESTVMASSIPALATLGDNAVRVQIEPSFSEFAYAIDFALQPKGCMTPHGGTAEEVGRDWPRFCRDVLVTYRIVGVRPEAEPAGLRQWTFHLPVEEWRLFSEGLDVRLGHWSGGRCCVMDGTFAGVERVHDGMIRSVGNNFGSDGPESANNPAWFAQTETQRLLLLFGPSGTVPRPTDWTVHSAPDPSRPCDTEQFATPDPDGWGVGEDRCAQASRAGESSNAVN